MSIRKPLCNYYSRDARQLRQEIAQSYRFLEDSYYASLPAVERAGQNPLQAKTSSQSKSFPPIFLLPHGAFCDSGPLVAHAFKILREENDFFQNDSKKTVVFIGTEHASGSRSPICIADFAGWATPLGTLQTDAEFTAEMARRLVVPIDNSSFIQEHSIENQLPYLIDCCEKARIPLEKVKIACVNIHSRVADQNAIGGRLRAVRRGFGESDRGISSSE